MTLTGYRPSQRKVKGRLTVWTQSSQVEIVLSVVPPVVIWVYAPEQGAKLGLKCQHLELPGHVAATPVELNPGATAGIATAGPTLTSIRPAATVSPAVESTRKGGWRAVRVCVRVFVCLCVCVCVRERERGKGCQ